MEYFAKPNINEIYFIFIKNKVSTHITKAIFVYKLDKRHVLFICIFYKVSSKVLSL